MIAFAVLKTDDLWLLNTLRVAALPEALVWTTRPMKMTTVLVPLFLTVSEIYVEAS